MKTVVVQNQGNHAGRPGLVGDWEWYCTQSVQAWAAEMGYDYKRTTFDESFDWYPSVWAKWHESDLSTSSTAVRPRDHA